MEPLTGRRILGRRWVWILATGTVALVVVGTVASTAGAATRTNPPIGASGSVAALNGTSMEVQNPSSGQTTVNWTSTTLFSKTVSESVSAITVGDCVTATGTVSKKSKTTVAARDITVSTPNSTGACGGTSLNGRNSSDGGTSAGGPPAGGPEFRTGSGGANLPKGAPSGHLPRQLASLSIASGKVTAVNGSTITVSGISVSPGSLPRSTKDKTKKPTTPKVQTLKVTTTNSTPVSATQTAASTDLAVGDCVSAFGPAATNGAVTASTVHIISTGGGNCRGGFVSQTPGGPKGGGGPQFFSGSGSA
jgi:hypothetical protein